MSPTNAARAAAAETASDPRNAQLGGEHNFSKYSDANQQDRDIVAAVKRSRADTGMAAAMRAAVAQRGRR